MKKLTTICLAMLPFLCGAENVQGQVPGRESNGLTFVIGVEGAGGSTTLTDNLRRVYCTLGSQYPPPVIGRIEWTADGNKIVDYRDGWRHLMVGLNVAREVCRIRQIAPDSPIILIGYSAGASVVMKAAEQLPPATLERIILLGPVMPSNYDPRRAIAATRLGLDCVIVPDDTVVENMEDIFGAPYQCPGTRVVNSTGFLVADVRNGLANDPQLRKLRHYIFHDFRNGHFDTVTPAFLRCNVVPMIPRGTVGRTP